MSVNSNHKNVYKIRFAQNTYFNYSQMIISKGKKEISIISPSVVSKGMWEIWDYENDIERFPNLTKAGRRALKILGEDDG